MLFKSTHAQPLLLRIGQIRGATPLLVFVVALAVLMSISFALGTPMLSVVMTAYLLAITLYLVDRQEKEFEAIRPLLSCSAEEADRLYRSLRLHDRRLILATWIAGPVIMLAINFSGPGVRALLEGDGLSLYSIWGFGSAMLFWIVACQMLLIVFKNSRLFASLGAVSVKLDLLDTAALVPFARVGIRNLLIYVGGYAALPLVWIDGPVFLPALLLSLIVTIPIMVALLFLPMLSLRNRISSEKAAELARIQRALHGDRDALVNSPIAVDADNVGFTGLVLYRQMIQEVREWPMDFPVFMRLSVYIVIPLLTWIGAALVERLVDVFLP